MFRHDLAKGIYDEILRKVAFGGKVDDGYIILEADQHELSYAIADVVIRQLRELTWQQIQKLFTGHILKGRER